MNAPKHVRDVNAHCGLSPVVPAYEFHASRPSAGKDLNRLVTIVVIYNCCDFAQHTQTDSARHSFMVTVNNIKDDE